jgi:hypothetical protein
MRFIFNFIFFGILFYLIYLFFPDAFHKLVTWAGELVEMIRAAWANLMDKMGYNSHPVAPTSPGRVQEIFDFIRMH